MPDPTDQSAPPQNAPTPSSMPSAPDVNNASAPPPVAPPIVNQPPATPPPPVAGQDLSDQNAHHSIIGKVFSALAGGKPTGYVQTDKGPVPVKTDWAPGQLARHIVASAASMIAAGIGGEQAAKNRRPFELAPGTSLGDIRTGDQEAAQKQAQEQFNNTQTANEATLRAHRDAMEQQEAIARLQTSKDLHDEHVQALTMNSRAMDEKAYDQLISHTEDYNKALAMPGATIMKDANGKELNFISAREAQDYALKHPEVIHGSTNGNTKYGVIPVTNPWTGSIQFVDYPADRHDSGVANFGQKHDKNGAPMFDKDGSPIPDGTVLDPRTKKPTVLTQTVTPDQAGAIASRSLSDANIKAEIQDRDAQARQRDSQARKNDELDHAMDVYATGNFDKMTDRQRTLVARMKMQEQTLASHRETSAAANLAKVQQINAADSPEAKAAQVEYEEAKDDYNNASEEWGKLTGNTPGVKLANAIIRQGIGNRPWAEVDKQISDAQVSDDDKQSAKAKVWNSLSPAQQAAANPTPATQANAAAAAPAGTPKHIPPANVPAGDAVIYDPQGKPHAVSMTLVDQYLANPQYKGWSK